uniref:Folate receptor-like domain-containing protein n=1 Tax=Brassica campestris TaxID=3711 RepID=M4FHF9_BRACM
MGGYSTKRMIMFLQLLTSLLLLHLSISSSSGEAVNSSENGVCIISKKGKLPKPSDLNMCNAFHGKTRCSASSALQNLATYGEASKDCLYLFELLECSDVGPLRICASFCDRVFEACSDAYFSTSGASNQVIVPCGASNGIICVKVFKWGTNGTSFCEAVGFTVVQTADDSACYGSSISSFGPAVKSLIKTENVGEAVNSSENVGVCVSKGGRSHQPYELEGKLPESADLEFRDLNMCSMFHEKTCCSASRMLSSSLALQNLATHGEASKDCLFWFELLECSICHPDVGVQSGPLRVCASFCDTVFEACSDAYFNTSDSTNQVIVPCVASNDTICEKASKLETNGTAFCEAVGFTVVQPAGDSVEEPCYGSKRVLETVVPVVESLMKTVRLQDRNYELLILDLQTCLKIAVVVLESTMIYRFFYQLVRDARRLRRRNRIRRRF